MKYTYFGVKEPQGILAVYNMEWKMNNVLPQHAHQALGI